MRSWCRGDRYVTARHGYLLKLTRAHEQFYAIKADIVAFIKDDLQRPAGTLQYVDTNAEWHDILWDGVQAPDPMLGVKVGEFIHNVRSALDHLAWGLVLCSGGTPTRDTMFPIYQSHGEWITVLEKPRPNGRASPLEGVAKGARALIKAAQPYHEGKRAVSHPLMKLVRLSNEDKHRRLHVAQVTAKRTGPLRFDPPGIVTVRDVRYAPPGTVVKNGAQVARVKLRWDAVPHAKMYVSATSDINIAFGEAGKTPIADLADLANILLTAMEIYEATRQFLVARPKTTN